MINTTTENEKTPEVALDPHESLLTAGVEIKPGYRYGFFTDTTLCIGCKACEVACKQWNNLPADNLLFTGESYDNTQRLSATTWRHVAFIEQPVQRKRNAGRWAINGEADIVWEETKAKIGHSDKAIKANPDGGEMRWLMMSDVCKHCQRAGCMEACPTGSLIRTEFDTVIVQQDICNGCGYCVPACPFGVIDVDHDGDGKAHKCTLCYDRMKIGLEPACSKSCPTDSIQFGLIDDLRDRATRRVDDLHRQGEEGAYIYGGPGDPGATGDIGSLNAFFLLVDDANVYNLPKQPQLPALQIKRGFKSGIAMAALLLGAAAVVFGRRP